MKLISLFLVAITLFSTAFSQESAKTWKISDYLENLPAKYKNLGNFAGPIDKLSLIDNRNGYAAYYPNQEEREKAEDPNMTGLETTVLAMALFKADKGSPTLIVTNLADEHVCMRDYSYFLEKRGDEWVDIREDVLPKIDFSLLFIDGKDDPSYKFYEEMQTKHGENIDKLELKFQPPRYGTRMKVTLGFTDCYWIEKLEEDDNELTQYAKISDSFKPIYLIWNSSKKQFEIENLTIGD